MLTHFAWVTVLLYLEYTVEIKLLYFITLAAFSFIQSDFCFLSAPASQVLHHMHSHTVSLTPSALLCFKVDFPIKSSSKKILNASFPDQ